MTPRLALFASVTLALAGANLMQAWALLASFLFTDQLPHTGLFQFAFWLWLPTAVAAASCGLYGGYTLLRRADVTSTALLAFALMSCIVFKISGQELGYSSVRLALNLGVGQFYVGVNVLGCLYMWWLATLRRAEERPLRSTDTEFPRGRGAV